MGIFLYIWGIIALTFVSISFTIIGSVISGIALIIATIAIGCGAIVQAIKTGPKKENVRPCHSCRKLIAYDTVLCPFCQAILKDQPVEIKEKQRAS